MWYFGEDTKEYEDGEVISTEGSWVSGGDGAQPGIIMQAEPQKGQPYGQEYYAGEAEDMGEVTGFSDAASVTYGSYDGLLVTREWTPLEPGIEENKYYASGVGLVLEEAIKGETARIELVAVTTE